MPRLVARLGAVVGFVVLAGWLGYSQDIPDAPQPKIQPGGNFPADAPPAPKNNHTTPDAPASDDVPSQPASAAPTDSVPTTRDELFKIVKNVRFVQIGVTVRTGNGHMVPGLTSKDFTVYEDGVPQTLNFFTSDPFPLSVAVIVDTNLPSATLKKVNETLPALVGAFSQFDEVALYRYGNTVQLVSGFTGSGSIPSAALEHLKRTGTQGGPPVVGGPFGQPQGTVNNHPVDPGATTVYNSPQTINVLNDAILRAAQDLSRRERGVRRRVLFVISDGREYGSTAHYDEVKKFLLSQDISVYALGVDTAALPVYDKVNRVRLPGFGYGDLLGKYASDTGGNVFAKFDEKSIEDSYEEITDEARNEYTLGFNTRASYSSTYRSLEVRVHLPDLKVTAKSGYYSLPPAPQPQSPAPQQPH